MRPGSSIMVLAIGALLGVAVAQADTRVARDGRYAGDVIVYTANQSWLSRIYVLRMDGSVWTTDKDGILLGLLAAEITAKTGLDPGEQYRRLTKKFGQPVYERIDARASPEQKVVLKRRTPDQIEIETLGGEKVLAKLAHAPGNGEPIGGVKVVTENAWFAVRPSGTENIYKLYTESFLGLDHVHRIQDEANQIIEDIFQRADVQDTEAQAPPAGGGSVPAASLLMPGL